VIPELPPEAFARPANEAPVLIPATAAWEPLLGNGSWPNIADILEAGSEVKYDEELDQHRSG